MKKLWIDTETTGLSPIINDVVQVAGIIEINHQTVETFSIYSRPIDLINISPKALAVNGLTIEQMKGFAPAELAYNQFNKILSKYVDTNNQYDRLIPCGHCVGFDVDFVSAWSTKVENDNFLLHHNRLDLMSLVLTCKDLNIYSGHTTLTAICKWLGVELKNAHYALSDIIATRECYYKIIDIFQKRDIPMAVDSAILKTTCTGGSETSHTDKVNEAALKIQKKQKKVLWK